MSVWPVLCSRFHSSARQQPGEPVIESPSGMIRTGVAALALGTVATAKATAAASMVSTAKYRWPLQHRLSLGRNAVKASSPGIRSDPRFHVVLKQGRLSNSRIERNSYRPVKSGLRFSTNAAMPSRRSSVANRAAKSWLSQARPERRSRSRPPSTASLAARSAWAGPVRNGRDQGHRRVVDALAGRHDPVDQPDGQRLVGGDHAARHDEFLRAGRADEPGQALGSAGARG